LSVAVVLMLFGAMVVSFVDMQSGARLNEGVDRFETLLRLCRAHSSLTGQRVRLDFIEEDQDLGALVLSRVLVTQETEPFNEAGIFQILAGPEWKLEAVNELVGVEEATAMYSDSTKPQSDFDARGESPDSVPWIMFFPDGSSDSVRVVLVSRVGEDDEVGRVEVLLQGITGEVRHRVITNEDENEDGFEATEIGYEPAAP